MWCICKLQHTLTVLLLIPLGLFAQPKSIQHTLEVNSSYSVLEMEFDSFTSANLYGLEFSYYAQKNSPLFGGITGQYGSDFDGTSKIDFGLQVGFIIFPGQPVQIPVGGILGVHYIDQNTNNHTGHYFGGSSGIKFILSDRFGINLMGQYQHNVISKINNKQVREIEPYNSLVLSAGFTFIL